MNRQANALTDYEARFIEDLRTKGSSFDEILLETESGFQVLILSSYGWDHVGGLEFEPAF